MLSSRFTQCSRLTVSTSSASSSAACLHTSAVRLSAAGRHKQVLDEKKIEAKRAEKQRLAQLSRPHVVLGNRPGDEAKWANCELAKVLITEEQILATPRPAVDSSNTLRLPDALNFGVGESEKELLFDVLPTLGVEKGTRNVQPFQLEAQAALHEQKELHKASTLALLADLRNANAGGIAYANRQRIVAAFSAPGKPNDTGRPEVQAALATYTIRKLWDHLKEMKKDVANRRNLRKIVHHRAKVLRYLKQLDRDRYENVLERLGLEPEAVEGELVV